ncbi:MAG: hypothetical protein IKB79_06850 [Oscillospiraceae bacterium]|nr:hypothetical protein [Oscillospiraceae bacterium]
MSGLEDKLNAILGNQEAMGQIMALAQSLGVQEQQNTRTEQEESWVPVETWGEEREPQTQPPDFGSLLGNIDPKMMQLGMRLLQEYNRADDRNAALLAALRPFVKEARFAKVDRAIQIARLSRVIRVLFDTVKEKGEGGLV